MSIKSLWREYGSLKIITGLVCILAWIAPCSAQEAHQVVATGVEASTPEVSFYYSRVDCYGFIRKPPVRPLGMIFKSMHDKELVSQDDTVYLRPISSSPTSAFGVGSRLTIYRTMKPTAAKDSEKSIGTQHYLTGVVEVTRSESNYAIAKVVNTYRTIRIGDLLMPYEKRAPNIKTRESTPGIQGRIIATENHDYLINTDTIAFIDKGKADNIHPGQKYAIYYQESEPDPHDKNAPPIILAPVDIGTFLVLHTEQTTSTVYITAIWDKTTPGFKFRSPPR